MSTSGFAPSTGTSSTRSGRAARSGPRPRSPSTPSRERPGGPPEHHRVGRVVGRVARMHDRHQRRLGGGHHGPHHIRAQRRLVPEHDDDGICRWVRHRGRETHAERARQPILRSRVHHAPLGSPLDRGLHVVGAPAQHHDRVGQAGVGDRVEGVLQEGPALERRKQLRRPEPGARAGGQDDRDHLHPVAPVATAASRARASSRIGRPVPDRRSATISAMIASAVSDGSRPPRSSPIGPVAGRPPPGSRRPRATAPGGPPGSCASRRPRRTGSRDGAPRRSPARRTSRRG